MRNLIILMTWVLLGYTYYCLSCSCCSDNANLDQSEVVREETQTLQVENSYLDSTSVTAYSFGHSEVMSQKLDSSVLLSLLPLSEDTGLHIVGYAYADEEDAYQLALLRAKDVQNKLALNPSQVRLKGKVSDQNYTDRSVFIAYDTYKIDVENISNKEIDKILIEGRNVYFYLDSYDSSVGLDAAIKSELRKTSWKLRNNVCKVELVSYNNNRRAGMELCYHFKEYLIRSGLSPTRITIRTELQGSRETSIVDLKIIE